MKLFIIDMVMFGIEPLDITSLDYESELEVVWTLLSTFIVHNFVITKEHISPYFPVGKVNDIPVTRPASNYSLNLNWI